MDSKESWAIVVAAGSGSRMGNSVPKQFAMLGEQPMVAYSLKILGEILKPENIVLVVPKDQEEQTAALLEKHLTFAAKIKIIAGGSTRYDSVKASLALLPSSGQVLIHDGARPFLSVDLIKKMINSATIWKASVPVIEVIDSIRQISDTENRSLERSSLRAVQTPQAFDLKTLKQAYALPYQASFTDDASVVEAQGINIRLVEGETKNRKITTPEDWHWALQVLENEKKS